MEERKTEMTDWIFYTIVLSVSDEMVSLPL